MATNEYRPRLRPSRKNKITRKDNLLIVACESPEETQRVEAAIVYALKAFPAPSDTIVTDWDVTGGKQIPAQ